jgi:hypothetical protein
MHPYYSEPNENGTDPLAGTKLAQILAERYGQHTDTSGCGTETLIDDISTSRGRDCPNAIPPDRLVLDDVCVDNVHERVSALSFERSLSDYGNTGQT